MDNMYEMKEFILANGMSQLPNSALTNDLSPYDYFDGGLDVDIDPEFSEASGRRRRAKRKLKRAKKSLSPKSQRKIGGKIAERRSERKEAQRSEVNSQNKAIAEIQKTAETDAQLLAQLNAPQTQNNLAPLPTATMGKKTKTALTIGGIAVGVFVAYLIYKKIKK